MGRVHHVRHEIHAGRTAPQERARQAVATARTSASATKPGAAAATCGRSTSPTCIASSQTFIKAPRDNSPMKIASGANVDDYHWTEVMMSQAAKHMDAYSLHYYTFSGTLGRQGPSTGFAEDEWAATLKNALRMDELVTKHSAIMDKYDPGEAGRPVRRRMGHLVRPGARPQSRLPVPAEHAARCARRRAHARTSSIATPIACAWRTSRRW